MGVSYLQQPLRKVSGQPAYTHGDIAVNQAQDGQIDLTVDSDLIGVSIRSA